MKERKLLCPVCKKFSMIETFDSYLFTKWQCEECGRWYSDKKIYYRKFIKHFILSIFRR